MKIQVPSRCFAWSLPLLIVLSSVTAEAFAQRGRGRGGDREEERGEREERGGDERGRGEEFGRMRGGFPGGGFPGGPGGGFPGGPGGPGGGFPGGPGGGFPGGGFPGGPGGGFPGGPGGPGGGFPGGGPGSFLSRLDRNGNNMLDPDEIDGRMRSMVERMAGEARIDLSRPIPLDTLTRSFERLRDERMREMGVGADGAPREGGTRGAPEYEPLVQGFGEVDLFDPVPGFGDAGERFAVKISDEDREEAARTLARNDRNSDGVLDEEELRRGRWDTDPLQTDRNRDGKLTLTELALRYAMRRAEREGTGTTRSSRSPTGSTSASSRSTSSSRDSASSRGSDDGRNRMLEMIFGRYDRNGNGVLDKDELDQLRGGGERYDTNQDGRVTKDELAAAFGRSGGRGDEEGGSRFYSRGGDGDPRGGEGREGGSRDASSSGDAGRKSYRTLTPAEKIASLEGLPDWFARSDMDQDGQVKMSEYASSWSDAVAADFAQFDLNNDGIVTANECLEAAERGAVQGAASASSRSSGYGSSSPAYASRGGERRASSSGGSGAESGAAAQSDATAAAATTSTTSAPAAAAVNDKYVKYAVGFIAKYDTNKDGVLVADEWKSMGKDYSTADTDGDGRLTPVELAASFAGEQR